MAISSTHEALPPLFLDNTGESFLTHTKQDNKTQDNVHRRLCFVFSWSRTHDCKITCPGSLTCCLEGIAGPLALPQDVSGNILGSTDVYWHIMRLASAHCLAQNCYRISPNLMPVNCRVCKYLVFGVFDYLVGISISTTKLANTHNLFSLQAS